MDARRSAVVARKHLARGNRRVALVAERLPLVVTHCYGTRTVKHFGERQVRDRNVVELSAIEESQRWPVDLLARSRDGLIRNGLLQRVAFVMELMTRKARYGRLLGKSGVLQLPRAPIVDWGDEIANAALKVHGMTTQAIVDQLLSLVLRRVEKDVGISGAVPA